MIKAYKESAAAWVENVPKIYDTATASRIDAPSAKTYDTATAAWVERLVLDNYFTEYAFSLLNGGSYTVSEDKRTISFNFKASSYGLVDSASLIWKGKPVTNGLFLGSFESSDENTDPDVYFSYMGQQVRATKLRTQDNNLFAINCEGLTVDEIVINIVPYNPSTFSLINLYFGQALKFEIE